MNSVKETIRKAIFGKLRTLRKKLVCQGVPCVYSRSVLSHDDGEISFKITCHVNGDTTILPKMSLHTGMTVEEFEGTGFEQGLARLRERFHVQ